MSTLFIYLFILLLLKKNIYLLIKINNNKNNNNNIRNRGYQTKFLKRDFHTSKFYFIGEVGHIRRSNINRKLSKLVKYRSLR